MIDAVAPMLLDLPGRHAKTAPGPHGLPVIGERMQEVAGNLKGALNQSIKDQPMATLAGAAIVGFVLGAIWKS